jgi:hypothetical protein
MEENSPNLVYPAAANPVTAWKHRVIKIKTEDKAHGWRQVWHVRAVWEVKIASEKVRSDFNC